MSYISVVPPNNDVTFSVGLTSGELSVNGSLDRETVSRYFVTVNVGFKVTTDKCVILLVFVRRLLREMAGILAKPL